MKFATYSFAAGAVALSATVFAMPTLFKRTVGDGTKVFTCFINAFTTGVWPTDCAAAAQFDVGIVQLVSVADLFIDFTTPNPLILGLSSTSLTANLISVLGINWPVTNTAQHVTIIDNNIAIATFDTPSSPASVSGGILSTVVGNCALKIIDDQKDNFSNFISALITQPSHTFTLRGSVDATLTASIPGSSALGSFAPTAKTFTVTDVGFSSPITLQACNNFPALQYIRQVSLTHDATTGEFTLVSEVNIHNPSQLVLILGNLTFRTVDKTGVFVGMSMMKNLKLQMGDNTVTVVTTSTSMDAYNVLVSTGETFYFEGFAGSSEDPILAKGISALRTSAMIPKLNGIQM